LISSGASKLLSATLTGATSSIFIEGIFETTLMSGVGF
jgi:hypothetical protein